MRLYMQQAADYSFAGDTPALTLFSVHTHTCVCVLHVSVDRYVRAVIFTEGMPALSAWFVCLCKYMYICMHIRTCMHMYVPAH